VFEYVCEMNDTRCTVYTSANTSFCEWAELPLYSICVTANWSLTLLLHKCLRVMAVKRLLKISLHDELCVLCVGWGFLDGLA